MSLSPERIASAFSRHAFQQTWPYLAKDIVWDSVGGAQVAGKAEVMAVCDEATTSFATITTTFSRFRVIVGGPSVVIDSLATYASGQGDASSVASCDIYDFEDGQLTRITSYSVEVS